MAGGVGTLGVGVTGRVRPEGPRPRRPTTPTPDHPGRHQAREIQKLMDLSLYLPPVTSVEESRSSRSPGGGERLTLGVGSSSGSLDFGGGGPRRITPLVPLWSPVSEEPRGSRLYVTHL